MTDTTPESRPGGTSERRANVVGVGLIGGSIALGLRAAGWYVSGTDQDSATIDRAMELEVLDAVGLDHDAEITFIATPAGAVPEAAARALGETSGVVTDVGSVKADIASAVTDPRFVGGHPMAGSEQDGVNGARPALFSNATWVLTPTDHTSEVAYTTTREVVRVLGAEVVSMDPVQHDEAVARISHVPHLTAATLMMMAAGATLETEAVLRLAAGGFRDMTRIAAGSPTIWLDICAQNRSAILDGIDDLVEALQTARRIVDESDRVGLEGLLTGARSARVNLPSGIPAGLDLCEVRVTMLDEPGQIARITTLAPEVNIYDFEIAHSVEGRRGVAIMVVALDDQPAFAAKLRAAGYRPSMRKLQ
ncbi:MAG: prephenate dehydrogenase/arogenate dehydrogenase family protein [Actinomycetota bacterium]